MKNNERVYLLELRLVGLLWSGQTVWFFRAVAYSVNLSLRIHVESTENYAPVTLAGCL